MVFRCIYNSWESTVFPHFRKRNQNPSGGRSPRGHRWWGVQAGPMFAFLMAVICVASYMVYMGWITAPIFLLSFSFPHTHFWALVFHYQKTKPNSNRGPLWVQIFLSDIYAVWLIFSICDKYSKYILFVFFKEPLLAFIFITFIIFLFSDSLVSAFEFANSFFLLSRLICCSLISMVILKLRIFLFITVYLCLPTLP